MDDIDYSILILGTFEDFKSQRMKLSKFIIRCFGNEDDNMALNKILEINGAKEFDFTKIYKKIIKYNISFENIFTFLDKAIVLTEFLQSFTDKELRVFHRSLIDCITYIISYYSYIQADNSFYKDFAKYIVTYRTSAKKDIDNLTLISMNWDSLFDNFIHNACIKMKPIEADIDYCIDNECIDNFLTSVKLKSQGNYNIKLLKPHGSTNWLICKNCGRLYTHYTNDITIRNMSRDTSLNVICEYCNREKKASELAPLIITPTYIKSLENVHLKSIWYNMYIEISQADELYFIGYSLPNADFELKYLLKKAVRSDTKIKVVLHKSDNPKIYHYVKKSHKSRLDLPVNRYIELFAHNEIEFNYNGFDKAFYDGYL